MWDRWVEIEPGDIAYFPEGLEHATRNPRDNDRDFVLVNSISPPQVDLYEPFGYYDKEQGVMRFEAIEEAKKKQLEWETFRLRMTFASTTAILS